MICIGVFSFFGHINSNGKYDTMFLNEIEKNFEESNNLTHRFSYYDEELILVPNSKKDWVVNGWTVKFGDQKTSYTVTRSKHVYNYKDDETISTEWAIVEGDDLIFDTKVYNENPDYPPLYIPLDIVYNLMIRLNFGFIEKESE